MNSPENLKSGLHTANLSWQTRVDKLKLFCVNGTKTIDKHVGKLLATNRACLFSRQLFHQLFHVGILTSNAWTNGKNVLVTFNQSKHALFVWLVWHFTKWRTQVKDSCGFRPMPSSRPHRVRPTPIQFDQVRPQPYRVTYRDYSSFFYPLRCKITGGEKTSNSWGRARNRKFIVWAKPVSFDHLSDFILGSFDAPRFRMTDPDPKAKEDSHFKRSEFCHVAALWTRLTKLAF